MRPSPRPLVLILAAVLAAGGCLPSSIGPTPPPPSPTPSPSPARPTPTPSPAPPTPTPAPTFLLYTVVSGDRLLTIAKRFKTTGRSIAYWNRDAYPSLDPESANYDPNRIEVGWTLRLIPGQAYEPAEDDSPTPEPTPQASLVIPPGPTPAAGTSVLVSNGARGGNAVALTFDLDPGAEASLDVLEWLVEHDIPATVFVTGGAGDLPGGRAVLALAAAHPDLVTLGSKGWDGTDVTRLASTAIADQLARTEALVTDATGRSSRPLFRPPFGAHDRRVRDAVGAAGWAFTVLWDVDSLDATPEAAGGPAPADIVTRVIARAQGGSVVLLHLGGERTLEALPGIVTGLRGRGLEPVTLHRLLGVEPGAGG